MTNTVAYYDMELIVLQFKHNGQIFYIRNLLLGQISFIVFPGKPFQPSLMFLGNSPTLEGRK